MVYYFADAIMSISKNSAMLSSGQYVKNKLADILEPPEKDNRSAEEIITDMRKKIRELGGDGNGGAA